MLDALVPPAPRGAAHDPEEEGVPLSRYAAVQAYLGEGIPLDASLDHAGLSAAEWPAIERAWMRRIAEDAAAEGALLAACDEHRIAASAHVERRLPPLDEDLGAFLDFFQAFSASTDPSGFLGERGMIEGDVFRLLDRWQPSLATDPAARDLLAARAGAEPRPVPEVKPRLPRLKPETRFARRAAIATPEAPAAPKAQKLATTGVAMPDLSKLPLPFAKQKAGDAPPAAAIPSPVLPKRSLGSTAPSLDRPRGPALPFGKAEDEPEPPPAPAAESPPIVAPPTIAEPPIVAPPMVVAQPAPVIVAPPTNPPQPRSPLGETAPVVAPSAPALPFLVAEPRLSLAGYARMMAAITADRSSAMAIIAHYGLTPETKRAEDAAWKAKMAADPAIRMAWVQALAEAGEQIRNRR